MQDSTRSTEAEAVMADLINELRAIALPYVGKFHTRPGPISASIKIEVDKMVQRRREAGNPFFIWSWNVELIGLNVAVRNGTLLFTETQVMLIVRQRWEEQMDSGSVPLGSYGLYDLYLRRNVGLVARWGDGDRVLTYATNKEDQPDVMAPPLRVAYYRAQQLGYQEWFPADFVLPQPVATA